MPVWLVVIVTVVLISIWIPFWYLKIRFERQYESELRTQLLSPTVEYRLDAALREAQGGFNVCTDCGFENFARVPFCVVCGTAIELYEPPSVATIKSKQGGRWRFWRRSQKTDESMKNMPGLERSEAMTTRQRRARKRKEWARTTGKGGQLRWHRDATFAVDGRGYVVRYQQPPRVETSENEISILVEQVSDESLPVGNPTTPQEQDDAEINSSRRRPTLLTKAEQSQLIQDDVNSTSMKIIEADDLDATQFPVFQVRDAPVNVHELLQLSASDFPSKYAHFVASTSTLITPQRQEQLTFHVERKNLLDISIELLGIIPSSSVRSSMRINFLNEQGVDAGGLHREWFMLLNEALVDPSAGIFTCVNPVEQTFFLNSDSEQVLGEDHLLYFFATGRLIGRALLDGHALGFHLCLPLLKIILGQPVTLGDLEFFDPEMFRSMLWILDNDVESLGFDFSVLRPINNGSSSGFDIVDLIPNGRNCAVTEENKQQFVTRRFQYLLFDSVADQLYMFLRGIYEVMPQDLLLLFDAEEFDYLLCGSDEIDVDDWERNTVHSAYLTGHPAKDWFWQIVREMPNEYRRRLLQFATGSSRVPLAGFSALTSFDGKLCPFTLKAVPLVDEGYISSHACFNRLDLPLHVVRQELRTVLYAILDTELYGFTIA